MADRYAVEAVKGRTNYFDGRVSGPVVVPAWIERGAITVAAANTIDYGGKKLGMPSYTFATSIDIDEVNRGDTFVQIPTDGEGTTAYTYDALEGKPIVTPVSSTGGVAGVLLTHEGSLYANPSSTTAADSITKRVSGKFYAVEMVKFYAMEYHPVKVHVTDASNIAPGDFLAYDVSEKEWVKDGSGTMVMACHYAAADDLYVGALFGPHFADSQA